MLCTKCHHKVRPVVSLDIDGTLGDFHTHFLMFAYSYLGGRRFKNIGIAHYKGDIPFRIWFKHQTGCSDETWHDIKLAYRQGAQKRTMPIYPDAAPLAYTCHKLGAEVWLTTTRPYLRLDNIDPDTRFWLDVHRIKYDGLVYGENKYKDLATIVGNERVCAILDDLVSELRAAELYFPGDITILRRNMFNTLTKWPQTAVDLTTAGDMIKERIEDWIVEHESNDGEGRPDDNVDVRGRGTVRD